MPRPIYVIAEDIWIHWPKPYFGAEHYLRAMQDINSIDDHYGAENAKSIVRYFLANAGTWRGEHARRIKNELKSMLSRS